MYAVGLPTKNALKGLGNVAKWWNILVYCAHALGLNPEVLNMWAVTLWRSNNLFTGVA